VNTQFSFATLKHANALRLPTFKNKLGQLAHSEPDGSDWSLAEWSNAMAGEAGELAEAYLLLAIHGQIGALANDTKKIIRGDHTALELRKKLAGELADVAIYLDLLASRCGIDLGSAIFDKFNEVSSRVRSPVFLDLVPGVDSKPALVFVRHLGTEPKL
jgi:NTP pyrophosphatase (non-canonical NTP hydrolase)